MYKVRYKNGKSGDKASDGVWECDCRGYILWVLRRLGVKVSSAGTNWMVRNQVSGLSGIKNAASLLPGQIVFKSRANTSQLPDKYKKGKAAYDEQIGEIDVYHVGIVTSANPLRILHCSTGGIL